MDLPTYTNIWRIEKRLYKLYDLRLPMPLPIVWIGVFVGVLAPWSFLLWLVGVPFAAPWHVVYLVPPGIVTWLSTRPVIESKRLNELLESQVRYLGEPRTWCRMAPDAEPAEVAFVGRVWRSTAEPARAKASRKARHAATTRRTERVTPAGPRQVRPVVAAAAAAVTASPAAAQSTLPTQQRMAWGTARAPRRGTAPALNPVSAADPAVPRSRQGLVARPVAASAASSPATAAAHSPVSAASASPATNSPAIAGPLASTASSTGLPSRSFPLSVDPPPSEPAVPEPVAFEPVAFEPVAFEPVGHVPAGEKPVAFEAVGYVPVAGEPGAREPVASEQAVRGQVHEPVRSEAPEGTAAADTTPAARALHADPVRARSEGRAADPSASDRHEMHAQEGPGVAAPAPAASAAASAVPAAPIGAEALRRLRRLAASVETGDAVPEGHADDAQEHHRRGRPPQPVSRVPDAQRVWPPDSAEGADHAPEPSRQAAATRSPNQEDPETRATGAPGHPVAPAAQTSPQPEVRRPEASPVEGVPGDAGVQVPDAFGRSVAPAVKTSPEPEASPVEGAPEDAGAAQVPDVPGRSVVPGAQVPVVRRSETSPEDAGAGQVPDAAGRPVAPAAQPGGRGPGGGRPVGSPNPDRARPARLPDVLGRPVAPAAQAGQVPGAGRPGATPVPGAAGPPREQDIPTRPVAPAARTERGARVTGARRAEAPALPAMTGSEGASESSVRSGPWGETAGPARPRRAAAEADGPGEAGSRRPAADAAGLRESVDPRRPAAEAAEAAGLREAVDPRRAAAESAEPPAGAGREVAEEPGTRVSIRAVPRGAAGPVVPVADPPARGGKVRRVESVVGRDTSGGWRRLAQVVIGSGGSRTDGSEIDEARARAVFGGSRRVVVLGCTGGAGQTTTALMLGHTFAEYRDDRVLAVDGNTGDNTLTSRIQADSPETLSSLLAGIDHVSGYLSMRSYTTRSASGLEVIGSDTDAGAEQRLADRTLFSDRRLGQTMDLLDRHYKLVVVDPAAALAARVLPYADQLVLVVPASEDGPDAVAMTYEWLDGHGCAELRRRAIMVVNGVSRRSMSDVEQAEAVARGRCRAIVRVPWEDDLAPGSPGPIEPAQLRAAGRRAYLALAGVVVAGFTTPHTARRDEEEVAQ
ncbi:conjugal transfer protein [Streptosporangium sp. KLBMP 9127]|nr:hypothetical protein [Streptosporangium sp. KLBMP 9127]